VRLVWDQHLRHERREVQVPGLWRTDLPLCEVSKAEQPLRVSRLRLHGSVTMGKVAAKLKVMPQSPEIDLDDLQERLEQSLPEGAKINGFERDDVAFGLVALLPTVIVPDDAGGTEAVEESFSSVDDVESVEVENVGRI
jgi:elongation factor 1-beta